MKTRTYVVAEAGYAYYKCSGCVIVSLCDFRFNTWSKSSQVRYRVRINFLIWNIDRQCVPGSSDGCDDSSKGGNLTA